MKFATGKLPGRRHGHSAPELTLPVESKPVAATLIGLPGDRGWTESRGHRGNAAGDRGHRGRLVTPKITDTTLSFDLPRP